MHTALYKGDKDHFPTKKFLINKMNEKNEIEEMEIVNVGREGISYSELKNLHNLSMLALANMLKHLPTSTATPQTIYSSKDVKISKTNNNYLIPYQPFKDPCFICAYYGHGAKNCPNIKEEFRGENYCLKCWETSHLSSECSGEFKSPPFNEHFLSPEEIISRLFYK